MALGDVCRGEGVAAAAGAECGDGTGAEISTDDEDDLPGSRFSQLPRWPFFSLCGGCNCTILLIYLYK
jgi:hypothetical protein